MKTPRLALFAFLALALAPLAKAADLPGWKVTDESFRSWPKVFFTVGGKAHTLNCRWAECNPEKNKSVSNLYVMKDIGVEKIQVTIMERVPLGRWDPRRRFGSEENRQGYTRQPKVIEAARRKYTTELSNFKLDNTGKELVVVQGNKKFPATTDIRWQYVDATGNVIAVAPPTKTADDLLKPENGGRGGNGGSGDRGGRSGSGAPSGKWWCDPKTGERYSAARGRRGSTLLASKDAPCKKTGSGTTPDPVVTNPATGTDASIALLDEEKRWLTHVQSAAYGEERAKAADAAARKVVDDKYRALIEVQIRPEGLTAYRAARAAAAAEVAAKTKEAAGKPEMWGGKDAKDVTAVISHFQKTASPDTAKMLEIQLSKADWDLLEKKPDEQLKYVQARARVNGMNGGVDNPVFDAKLVDPIALRLSAVAARKAVGSPEPGSVTTPTTGKPDETALLDLLTPKEKEFLTPAELENYESILLSAPEPKQKDQSVQNELKKLRPRIKEREGKPYLKEPITEKNFDQAADWQKDKFCTPAKIGGAIAASGPKSNETVLNAGGDAAANLTDVEKKAKADLAAQQAAAAANPLPAWAVEKCKGKPFFKEPAPSKPTDTNLAVNQPIGGGGSTTSKPLGKEVENPEKEKSKWLTQDLLTSAAKGAMVGLLVGSLFGPVGLIAGPLLGGALFYGLTKLTE